MPFDRFMRLALYDEAVGYYRKPGPRVGYAAGTDFFTATTSGPLFGELVEAAIGGLLPGGALQNHMFVEIGAEPGGGVMQGRPHRFKSVLSLPLGSALELAGPCVVFSNELFDAQPCRRFVRQGGRWLELGVACRNRQLREIALGPARDAPFLPADGAEGYILDAPEAAVALLGQITRQPWHGLFVACDYGKTWAELSTAVPAGTARAYHRHTQSNDLLARPGEQDLTCHICWDWLVEALSRAGFSPPTVESQEAFFVRHAAEFMARTVAGEAQRLSPRKLALMQLLHPSHLGQKFQVLHALRPARK
jgi:SAM-dependent MidA family methyltransferase